MGVSSQKIFEFDGFRLDAEAIVLYRDGEVVKGAERHSLQVLAVILSGAEHFASYEEIIQAVWPDVEYGVDSARINQHISKLRRLFAVYDPDTEYFENLRGRGYRFTGTVTHQASVAIEESDVQLATGTSLDVREKSKSQRKGFYFSAGLVALLLLTGLAIWRWDPMDDDAEVRRVVKESQLYESLVLYKNPQNFQESDLDKYWTAEIDIDMNFDRGRIK